MSSKVIAIEYVNWEKSVPTSELKIQNQYYQDMEFSSGSRSRSRYGLYLSIKAYLVQN